MTNYYAVFFKNKNPFYVFARLIEWVDGTDFSHCEIVKVVDDNWAEAICYGSVFPESRSILLKEMVEHYEIKVIVPLLVKVKNPDVILTALMNRSYSLVQILLIGIKILTGSSISWLPYVKVNLSKILICTEAVSLFMQEACQYKFEESPEMLSVEETLKIAMYNLPKNEV